MMESLRSIIEPVVGLSILLIAIAVMAGLMWLFSKITGEDDE